MPLWLLQKVVGNNVALAFLIAFVLTGIGGGVAYEVLRVLFRRWSPSIARILAYFVALLIVVYPADPASRYWLVWAIGMRVAVLQLFALIGLWTLAVVRDDLRWLILAAVIAITSLLLVEYLVLVSLMMPFMPLFFGRRLLQKRWLIPMFLWFVMIGLYLTWRVFFANTGVVLSWIDGEPYYYNTIANLDIGSLVIRLADVFLRLTLVTLDVAYNELRRLPDGLSLGLLLSLGIGALLPVIGLLLARLPKVRADRQTDREPASERHWWMLLVFAVGLVIGSAFPGVVTGTNASGFLPIDGNSRLAAIPSIGIAILLVLIAARIHLAVHNPARQMPWRLGLLACLLVTVVFVSAGIVRHRSFGYLVMSVSDIQNASFHELVERFRYITPGKTIMVIDMPYPAYFFEWRVKLPVLRADRDQLFTVNPDPPSTLHDLSYTDDTFTYRRAMDRDPTTVPLDSLVMLQWDPAARDFRPLVEAPASYVPAGQRAPRLFTGDNAPLTPNVFDGPLDELLLNIPASDVICETTVPVASRDTALENGAVTAVLYPQGTLLDRRPVKAGEPLNYAFQTTCGTWIQLYFEREDEWAFLPSQYVNIQYGTAEADTSISYDTAFSQLGEFVPMDEDEP